MAAGKGDPAHGIPEDHGPAERTGDLAIAAIIGGIDSQAWADYMNQFGELIPFQTGQLERLLATDGTRRNPDLDEKRAYLVANGSCGMTSPDTGNLDFEVETIDAELAPC